MKKILFCIFIFSGSFNAFAGTGPTGLGPIHIGMSKAEYISATGIKPTNCNTAKNDSGDPAMLGLKNINVRNRTLCGYAFLFSDTGGSVENIRVKGLSYDVIQTEYSTNKFFNSIGNGIKAFFIKDIVIHELKYRLVFCRTTSIASPIFSY